MNIATYPEHIPLAGDGRPPAATQLFPLLEYLATVAERHGNTAVTYRIQWGAAALHVEDLQKERIAVLGRALGESVKLQSHYAQLLNGYDGGERMCFPNAAAWIERIEHVERIAGDPAPAKFCPVCGVPGDAACRGKCFDALCEQYNELAHQLGAVEDAFNQADAEKSVAAEDSADAESETLVTLTAHHWESIRKAIT